MIRITTSEGKQYLTYFAQLQSGQSIDLDEEVLTKKDLGNIYVSILTGRVLVSENDKLKIRNKILENTGGVDLEELSPQELESLALKLINTGEFVGDSNVIESISVNGQELSPDNNKNININISSSGGGINVIDYDPEDYVIISGPEINPSMSQGSEWNEPYLTLNGNSELVEITPENSYRYISVDLDIPSSGTIELDITNASIVTQNNSEQNTTILFLPSDSNPTEFYSYMFTGVPPKPEYYFSYISVGTTYINTIYSSSILGMESNSTPTTSKELTIRFMNYIEFMIQVNNVPIEQLYQQMSPEEISMYSSLRLAVLYEKGSPITDILSAVTIESSLGKLLIGVSLFSENEISSNVSLKIDNKERVHSLPTDAVDGTYLKIKSDVILLGEKLEAGDYFILHSNRTKGIKIKLYNEVVETPTGKFRGNSYTEPTDPVTGDWYIKNVYNSSTNSYSNLMYVWSNSSWELVGYVPASGSGSLSDLNYNSTTNRLMNDSGRGVAGYLGAFYSGSPPLITTWGESSLYYNISENKFKYSNSGNWTDINVTPDHQYLGFLNSDPAVGYNDTNLYYNFSTNSFRTSSGGSWFDLATKKTFLGAMSFDPPRDVNALYYNNVTKTLKYCDHYGWYDTNNNQYRGAFTTADLPVLNAGDIKLAYDLTEKLFKYSAAGIWTPIDPLQDRVINTIYKYVSEDNSSVTTKNAVMNYVNNEITEKLDTFKIDENNIIRNKIMRYTKEYENVYDIFTNQWLANGSARVLPTYTGTSPNIIESTQEILFNIPSIFTGSNIYYLDFYKEILPHLSFSIFLDLDFASLNDGIDILFRQGNGAHFKYRITGINNYGTGGYTSSKWDIKIDYYGTSTTNPIWSETILNVCPFALTLSFKPSGFYGKVGLYYSSFANKEILVKDEIQGSKSPAFKVVCLGGRAIINNVISKVPIRWNDF